MVDDYLKAKHMGDRAYRRAVQAGEYPYLPALDDILSNEDVVAENKLGLKEIPLSMIAGTKTAGRQQAFALNFMPLMKDKSEFATKWITLFDSQMKEGLRDPIIVYEFMNKFYVLEGNKRVSVMKFMGAASIPAYVTRILPKRTDEKENRIYYEYVDFYKVTGLFRITFSEEGCYKKLAYVLGQNLTDEWPEELCNTVKASFVRFSELYDAKGGARLDLTHGDAYLIYLSIFGMNGLLDVGDEEIGQRIGSIWNELLTESNEQKIALIEGPGSVKKQPRSMIDFLNIPPLYTEKRHLKIAFIYERSVEHSSWAYGHELGRNQLKDKFGNLVDTVRFENCDTDEEVMNAIDLAVSAGTDMIFTTSAAQIEAARRAAIKYPEVKFLNCSVNESYSSVRSYYGRMYEAKFLMGALAASVSRDGRIGYVADYPIYGIIANINAFAIGAALVNPQVKIVLKWSTKTGCDWRREFAEEGIRCISGPDWIRPHEASREFGIFEQQGEQITNLAMPVWQWGRYYELIVRSVLEGGWDVKDLTKNHQAINYWWGMSAGVIDVILSGQLPYYSRKFIDILKKEVISGDLSPFDGELRSQTGVIKTADAPRLSSEEIINMDWLNDNVCGSIPKVEELVEQAREVVRISGVREA